MSNTVQSPHSPPQLFTLVWKVRHRGEAGERPGRS